MADNVGNALWGKGGGAPRRALAAIACTVVAALAGPGLARAADIPASLLGEAQAHPSQSFDVIVQSAASPNPTQTVVDALTAPNVKANADAIKALKAATKDAADAAKRAADASDRAAAAQQRANDAAAKAAQTKRPADQAAAARAQADAAQAAGDAQAARSQADAAQAALVLAQVSAIQQQAQLAASAGQALGQIHSQFAVIPAVSATVTGQDILSLQASTAVTAVTSDSPVVPTGDANPQKWVDAAQIKPYWGSPQRKQAARSTPTIAIVDSGIDPTRAQDFGARILGQVNFVSQGPNSAGDGRGHGTMVASIAAGGSDKRTGTNPDAPLIALDVINDNGEGRTSDVIAAADWILANRQQYNIRVANFSLQSAAESSFLFDPLAKAVESLWFNGVVVVTAAGNYASNGASSGMHYAPASDPFVITVGAVDINNDGGVGNDVAAPWSAWGYTNDGFLKPEISAPGRYIVGACNSSTETLCGSSQDKKLLAQGYAQLSGTSFAAPMVSGAAAAILALHPDWTPDQVKGQLMLTANYLKQAVPGSVGVGELNVKAATDPKQTAPPNPNAALSAFVVQTAGGPVFDGGSWSGAAQANASWNAASWNQASWNAASWNQASWNTASWNQASWNAASWNQASWNAASWNQASWNAASWNNATSGLTIPDNAASDGAGDPAAGSDPAPPPGPKEQKEPKLPKGGRDDTTILVKFAKPGYDNDSLVQQDGDQAVGMLRTKTVIVKLKKGADVDAKIAEYQARDDVLYAEANSVATASDDVGAQAATAANVSAATVTTNDTYSAQQWALPTIRAYDAWSVAPAPSSGSLPPIAVVDSGVDSLHPDLAGTVATDLGANCLTGVCVSDGATDDYGHGTHVAGLIAAHAGDNYGIAGTAYDAPIIPVKVLDSSGNGSYAAVAAGIDWAADHGAKIINVSLGSTAYSQTVCDAVTYATNAGAVVVAAAGNLGATTPFYPAACPGAVGVGATDSTDTVASFSERAYPNVFVTAPGVDILSDYLNSSFATQSGTSMAAPYVSAIAGLLLAQNPNRTASDVKMMLAGTADKVGSTAYGSDPYATCACTWNASYGYGRVNAYRALTEAPPAPAPDFAMGSSALTLTVQRGKSGAFTVSSSSTTGFSSAVSLSVTGLPSGATASFSPTSIAGVGSSTLTISASTSAPYGSYPLTIKGTSGGLVRTVPVTLVVPSPDYTLKLGTTSATIVQSEKGTSVVSLNNLFGFASTVGLAVSGAPAGVTTTLSSSSISGTKTSTLTIATAMSAVPGTYPITVTGTSGSLVRTAIYTLTVAQAVPDFTLASATTSTAVRYGRSTTISYKLSLGPKYGFTGAVTLSAAGNPPGTRGTWNPSSATVNLTTSTVYAYYSLPIPAGTPVGTYYVTFTGTAANGTTHTATAKITIS